MHFSIPVASLLFLMASATLSWGRHSSDFNMQRLRRSTDSAREDGYTVPQCPFASKPRNGFEGGFVLQDFLDNSDARHVCDTTLH
ncbi:hypothetical protein MRX96_017182 [Rhipicephalus microplus]